MLLPHHFPSLLLKSRLKGYKRFQCNVWVFTHNLEASPQPQLSRVLVQPLANELQHFNFHGGKAVRKVKVNITAGVDAIFL